MNLKNNTKNRTCYYFDDIMEVEDINVARNLLGKKSYESISVYSILYQTFMDGKPLRIRFTKADGIINIYDGIKCLELFNSYIAIFDRINYLISEKVE